MTTSAVNPTYPSGVFQWNDRVDNVNIDFANDINSAVAEIESIESVFGSNPQIETGVPGSGPITYNTVSDRITDAMTNAQLPYCALLANAIPVSCNNAGQLIQFKVSLDTGGCYNGTDITIPFNGWWSIQSTATWSWNDRGYCHHQLCLNGANNCVERHIFDLEFSGNVTGLQYSPNGTPVQQSTLTPRYYKYGKRPVNTKTSFEGPLHAGDHMSIYLENGQPADTVIQSVVMKCQLIRLFPDNVSFTSG